MPLTLNSRAFQSGPTLGYYEVFSGTITAASATTTITWYNNCDVRIVECGWNVVAITGTPTIQFGVDTTPETAVGITAMHAGTPGLAATPFGVMRPSGTSTTLNLQRVVPSTSSLKFTVTLAASTVTNLTVYMVGWRTSHFLASPAND